MLTCVGYYSLFVWQISYKYNMVLREVVKITGPKVLDV